MEKKIIVTLNENGTLQIDYPNDISFMETIGVLDSTKAILLDRYVNPKVEETYSENMGLSHHDGKTVKQVY